MSAQDEKEKDPLIGITFANRYAIQGRLGKGGMAVVYRATDTQMARDVALKVLRPDVADEVAAKRLIREAKGAGALNHPNIITIFDRGIWEDRVYIAMEILNGREMSDLMEKEGAIPVLRALKIAEQVASALAVAHAEGIIHRDIKPENLFLLNRAGADVVKMLDFSIAKLPKEMVTQQLTRAGSVFGTPHYMAPEQVEGKQAVPQTDLYALGAVLYELITGEPPYDGNSVIDILLKHVKAPVPSMERPGVELPPGLADLVKELLAKKPADRPESAEIVRERIADMLAMLRMGATSRPSEPVPQLAPSSAPPTSAPPSFAPPSTPSGAAQDQTPVRAAPAQRPQTVAPPADLPNAAPADHLSEDDRTIVGVGMSEKLNEMIRAQKAAAGGATGPRPPTMVPPPITRTSPQPPVPAPQQAADDGESDAPTMAVSKETLQALQASRKGMTMAPPGPARAPTGSAPAVGRAGGRETVDDRGIDLRPQADNRTGRETSTELPPAPVAVSPESQSKLWLVGVVVGAALIGGGVAWFLTNR